MNTYLVGDRVKRVKGAAYQLPDTGVVVDKGDNDHLRVKWEKANKRTWVHVSTVRLIDPLTEE